MIMITTNASMKFEVYQDVLERVTLGGRLKIFVLMDDEERNLHLIID